MLSRLSPAWTGMPSTSCHKEPLNAITGKTLDARDAAAPNSTSTSRSKRKIVDACTALHVLNHLMRSRGPAYKFESNPRPKHRGGHSRHGDPEGGRTGPFVVFAGESGAPEAQPPPQLPSKCALSEHKCPKWSPKRSGCSQGRCHMVFRPSSDGRLAPHAVQIRPHLLLRHRGGAGARGKALAGCGVLTGGALLPGGSEELRRRRRLRHSPATADVQADHDLQPCA